MKAFNYQAVNQQGTKKSGIIEADSAKAVRQQLRERGLIPIDVQSIEKNVAPNRQKNKLKVRDLSLMTRQLATLIAARLPIEQALQGVSEQSEKKQTKSILLAVRSKVLEGHSLANALKQFPNAFPPLYCATIEAGEQTGKLDIVLNRLADYTEQQHAMRLKVQQALIYPSVMTVISIGIITFLLTFVVPKIIGVFNSTGQSLPQLTQTLIHISDFIKQHGLLTFGLMIVALMAFKQALKKPVVKMKWHQLLLKIPLISYLIRSINTSRFSHTLAILSSGGVPILKSMSVARDLISNLPINEAVTTAVKSVKEGSSLSKALKRTKFFSPMSIHLIASGENSGQLDTMLEHAAQTQDNDVSRIIETGLTLFEPFIILFMGAVVLFIVLATLLPIFTMDQLVR